MTANHLKYSLIYFWMKRLRALVIVPFSSNYWVIFLNSHPIYDSSLIILFTVSDTLISGLRALNPFLSVKIKSLDIFWREKTIFLRISPSETPCYSDPRYLNRSSFSVRKVDFWSFWWRAVVLKLGWVWFNCCGACFLAWKVSFNKPSKST